MRAFRRTYLIGHACDYTAAILSAALGMAEARYLGYFGIALQILASLGMWRNVRGLNGKTALVFASVYLAAMAAYGGAMGNRFEFWGLDVLAFGLLTGVAAGEDPLILVGLRKLYSVLLIPGSIGALAVLLRVEPGSMESRFISQYVVDSFAVRVLCMPAAFLVLSAPGIGKWTMRLCAVCLAIMFTYGVFTATRTEIFIPIVVMLLVPRVRRLSVRQVLLPAGGAMSLSMIALMFMFGPERLANATTASWERFANSSEFSAGRDQEAAMFLSSLEPNQWMFGKGLGGAYQGLFSTEDAFGFNMVHFGHLHLMLKGGITLAVLLIGLVIIAIYNGWRVGTPGSLGSAAYLILFSLINVGHQQVIPAGIMAFFAISLGYALKRVPRPNVFKGATQATPNVCPAP